MLSSHQHQVCTGLQPQQVQLHKAMPPACHSALSRLAIAECMSGDPQQRNPRAAATSSNLAFAYCKSGPAHLAQPLLMHVVQLLQVLQLDPALLRAVAPGHALRAHIRVRLEVDEAVRAQRGDDASHQGVEPDAPRPLSAWARTLGGPGGLLDRSFSPSHVAGQGLPGSGLALPLSTWWSVPVRVISVACLHSECPGVSW